MSAPEDNVASQQEPDEPDAEVDADHEPDYLEPFNPTGYDRPWETED